MRAQGVVNCRGGKSLGAKWTTAKKAWASIFKPSTVTTIKKIKNKLSDFLIYLDHLVHYNTVHVYIVPKVKMC
jgi:hypothetical protein